MTPQIHRSRGKCNSAFWTDDKIMKLIEEFENRSDLWDTTSPLYRNRKHKLKLQEEIAELLGTNITEVNAKLHNLRCQYNGELRKFRQRKNGSDEEPDSRWKFFSAMQFLPSAIMKNSESVESNSNLFPFDEHEIDMEDSNMISEPESDSSTPPSSCKRQKRDEILFKKVNNFKMTRNLPTENSDSTILFCNYLNSLMCKLNEGQQTYAQSQILNIVFQLLSENEND